MYTHSFWKLGALLVALGALAGACAGAVDATAEQTSQELKTISARDGWKTFRVDAHRTRRVSASLEVGVRYRVTWTDHWGYPRDRRRPDVALDVRVIDPDGRSVGPIAHNSIRTDNGLDPDPLELAPVRSGAFVVELTEVAGYDGTFELSLEQLGHAPSADPEPPVGIIVHEAGDTRADAEVTPTGAIALAGGGRDNDAAMRAWVEAGAKGDAVVLRMDDTGGGYASYLRELGARSVREIVFDPEHGNDDVEGADLSTLRRRADAPWTERVIDRAEMVFIAGGNQTKYLDAWRGTRLAQAVSRVVARHGAIGGTSAGMHVLGGLVHTPRGGGNSITSAIALADPYVGRGELRGTASLEMSESAFAPPLLADVITDTHWSQRDRLGRSVVFLARALRDGSRPLGAARLVACDEGTAVVIGPTGVGRVFGPASGRGAAFFFAPDRAPEVCADGRALEWAAGVPMVRVDGTPDGRDTFDLRAWSPGAAATRSRVVVTGGVVHVQ
ncbi:MAG: Type 1 glutamine amidotransferase-like domain-containing protein [Polyangiaceae bacterium]